MPKETFSVVKETPWWYRVLWVIGMLAFRFLFRLSIEGKVPARGAVVIIANHRSYLDPVVLALLTPRRINFMAKEELFRNPVFGYLIHKLGAFPLKRDSLDKTAYQKALKVLEEGKILALFPEGTRSLSGKLGNFKQGSVRIAIYSRVPIIPVVIMGTEKVLPPGRKIVGLGKIRIKAGDPILPQNFNEKDRTGNILQNVRERMITLGANR